MSNQRIRSRDPEVRAYTDRLDSLSSRNLNHAQLSAEVRAIHASYEALSPEQRRTLRYNAAEEMRRRAEQDGNTQLLRILGEGFAPGPLGIRFGLIHIDSGRYANGEERRALGVERD